MLVSIMSVKAVKNTCPTAIKKQLANEANYIKVDYEIKDTSEYKTLEMDGKSTKYKIPNYYFEISLYNLTDNLYAQITANDQSKKTLTVYNSSAVDGTYTFVDSNFGEIYNYTIMIRSNNPECQGATIRTLKFTKPRYNAFSEFAYCQNSSNFYCQRFIGTEIDLTTTEFLSKIKTNNKSPDADQKAEIKEIGDIFKKNWKTYLLVFLGLAVASVAIIFFVRMYNKKKGWRL